jgi:DNA-directed RNA polymerase subunit RPC12/RpoP
MPSVQCPRCGRNIAVTLDELTQGLRLECADCFARFAIGKRQSAPAPTAADQPPLADFEEIPSVAPPSARSRALAITMGIVGGLLLVAILAATGLALSGGKSARKTADAAARPAASPPLRPTPAFHPEPARNLGKDPSWAGAFLIAVGLPLMAWGLICSFGVAYMTLLVLLLAWVARDARARSVDGGAVWVLVIFLTGPVGFLVYLASRPQGMLVACSRCGNKRLIAATMCPHCGQAVAA